MFTDEEIKQMSMNSLTKVCEEIISDYSIIYDKYHKSDMYNSDIAFLHDLVDVIKPINTILYVYNRDKHINKNYAIEKLTYAKNLIDYTIRYFEEKGEDK